MSALRAIPLFFRARSAGRGDMRGSANAASCVPDRRHRRGGGVSVFGYEAGAGRAGDAVPLAVGYVARDKMNKGGLAPFTPEGRT